MRAAVLHGREDVRVESVPRPRPGPGEVLLRNRVALTCGTDVKVFRRGYHARMITPPSVFGHEVAGVIEEVGPGVLDLEPGTPAVVANSAPCGECEYCLENRPSLCDRLLFWNGAYAEFSCIPSRIVEKNLLRLPPQLSFRRAALVEPLACVVRGVSECGLVPAQTAAVIGVGPIGLMFVSLLRERGVHVIVAGRRPERLRKALELGAAAAIAAQDAQDLERQLRENSPDGRGPHVVIEAAGSAETSEAAIRSVRKGGKVNLFGGCPAGTRLALDAARLHYDELSVFGTFHHTPNSVREALRLIVEGRIDAEAFITGEAPLERLPEVLGALSLGGPGLKTAIVLEPFAPIAASGVVPAGS